MQNLLEPFQVASKIENCIKALSDRCFELEKVGEEKVKAEVEYDKEFEMALATLADMDVPVGVRDKRAKGVLAKSGITE